MEFETPKSRVYIQTDNQSRILRCEGGYTTPADLTDWTEIDEGTGDRFNLCQSHYFDRLYTDDEIPRYRWDGTKVILRTDEEIEEDRKPDLNVQKKLLISSSKIDLANYLESHPLTWIDNKEYNVTAEKQNLLASQIALYQTAKAAGQDYELHWNSTGGVCTTWTIEELSALALAIGAYVQPLVTYQQSKEIEIMNCTTIEELNNIVIDYSSVQ